MRPPALHLIGPDEPAPAAPVETVAQRIRSLQAEAKRLATDHVATFAALMADVEAMAAEINEGGAAFHEGARSVAREVGMHCESRRQILEALKGRGS